MLNLEDISVPFLIALSDVHNEDISLIENNNPHLQKFYKDAWIAEFSQRFDEMKGSPASVRSLCEDLRTRLRYFQGYEKNPMLSRFDPWKMDAFYLELRVWKHFCHTFSDEFHELEQSCRHLLTVTFKSRYKSAAIKTQDIPTTGSIPL